MPEVRQEEMIEYMKQHLPALLMTCEDSQGVTLWAKYGGIDLKTAGQWDFNKIPDDDARKQIWEYLYPLLMWEKETPGATQHQDELGSIRYVLNQGGWKWSGTDYSNGISFEKFLKGEFLIIIEYGTFDVVSKELPITGGPIFHQRDKLHEINEALKSMGWILKDSTEAQDVVYAIFEKGGYGIHMEMGSMMAGDEWSDENKIRWEKETGDSINSPGGAQRFVEWVNKQPGGGPGEEPVTQHHMMDPETLFVLTTEDVRTMAQQIGIDPNKLTGVHYNLIKKGIESGLGSWAEVMSTAIREAIRIEPIR